MDKLLARRDFSYCVNPECSYRDNCRLSESNYDFIDGVDYSFYKDNPDKCGIKEKLGKE